MDNEIPMNFKWNLWYHSITNKDWSERSYVKILTIENIYDYYLLINTITIETLQNGMFFIMKDGIFPFWEDPKNREGCSVSFKISVDILLEEWRNIITELIYDKLRKENTSDNYINGISISPKKGFNIIKYWLSENDKNYDKKINEYPKNFIKSKALVKKHNPNN